MSEATRTINVVQSEDFNQLLYRVGNHEGKTAIAALMLNSPHEMFNIAELRERVRDSQGDNPAWVPAHPVVKRYCYDFLSAQIIERSEVGYSAQKAQRAQRLAFLGSILGFSCDFPDTSVQKIFGQSSAGKSHQSPNLRYDICKIVTNNNGHEISIADIVYLINNEAIGSGVIEGAIRALAQEEILKIHVLDISTDVRLRIVDPDFSHKGLIPFNELNPTTRLVYRVLKDLSSKGKQDIGFDDLCSHALALDPHVDLVSLRKRWQLAVNGKSKNFPGVERSERKIKDPYKISTVGIHPAQKEAIHAILHRLDDVQSNPELAYRDWELAQKIVLDESAMRQIFTKAKRFSASAARIKESGEQKKERILKTIQEMGSLTLADLAAHTRAIDRPLTLAVLRRYLRRLVEESRVTQEYKPRDPASERKIAYYSVREE